jgi:hypothetical protein
MKPEKQTQLDPVKIDIPPFTLRSSKTTQEQKDLNTQVQNVCAWDIACPGFLPGGVKR